MKLYGDFLWTRRQLMGQGCAWGCSEESTTHQGTLGGPGAPWWVVPPMGHPQAQPGPIMFLLVQKNLLKVLLRLDSV